MSPRKRVHWKVPAASTPMSSQIDKTLSPDTTPTPKLGLVIHSRAGTMDKTRATPELGAQYRAALKDALRAGYEILGAGGEAMDAAVATAASMEGAPNFDSTEQVRI